MMDARDRFPSHPRGERSADGGPAGFRYPMETLKDRYVTLYGGASFDLKPLEIGVHAEALRRNTHLAPFSGNVIVTSADDARARPLIGKPLYTIVPLDERRPEALELSRHGEAVFSCYELDAHEHERSPLHALREGSTVTLNAVLSRHWSGPGQKWNDLFRLNPRDLPDHL